MKKTELTVTICGETNNSTSLLSDREVIHEYYGLSGNMDDIHQQMLYVSQYFDIEAPLEMIHLIVNYGTLVKDDETAAMYSRLCQEYFCRNHQIYCCTHQEIDSLRYHTHLMINPVSYVNGKIFNTSIENMNWFCEYLSGLFGIPARLL